MQLDVVVMPVTKVVVPGVPGPPGAPGRLFLRTFHVKFSILVLVLVVGDTMTSDVWEMWETAMLNKHCTDVNSSNQH